MPGSVIVSSARTPIGKLSGAFASLSAMDLGGFAIKAALERAGVAGDQVGYVLMGQVLQAGQGQMTARQAAVNGGIPMSVPAMTVNKVCLSGVNAIYLADQMIQAGDADIVIAGGMESMTAAPYFLPGARAGYRMGDGKLVDSLINDGLWCAFDAVHMGAGTEKYATETGGISRELQDELAAKSHERAAAAMKEGRFTEEIAPVAVPQRKGDPILVENDEGVRPGTTIDSLGKLKPAFAKDGTITAGNASSLNDGAAAVVLAAGDVAAARGLTPIARIVGFAGHAQAPEWFTTAPTGAIGRLLEKIGWRAADVDLWEINEAFAVVSLINNRMLGLDPARVNVWGGAVALGHPIGASGARLLVTLLSALRDAGKRRGVVSLCIGGGEAIALAVELVS
jgi:acetyl-CoA C-acetyltransferase